MVKLSPHKKRLYGSLLLFLLGLDILIFLPDYHPPNWMELSIERIQDWQRIQTVGGWTALQRDCNALATKYKDDSFGFRWSHDDTNLMPPTIAALNPYMVEFLSPKVMQQLGGSDGDNRFGTNLVVRIYIFGHHTTGMHEKPWLGFDVLCGSSVTNYNPIGPHPLVPMGSWHWQYRKVADGIYEHYIY